MPAKERPGQKVVRKVGDLVDKSLSTVIEGSDYEAPLLEGGPLPNTWYRLSLPDGKCADGSEYHIYIKTGNTDSLMVFLSGGGLAYDEFSAARPVTGGSVAAWEPNFYWSNLRPLTQMMNINVGITDITGKKNPFSDWNMVVITYATGDFHVGDSVLPYKDVHGEDAVLYFHGHANFVSAMKAAKKYFPETDKLLIAGDSAGAFAVPALAGEIADDFYPDCDDITLFSDSAQLIVPGWRHTVKDVWKAGKNIYEPLVSENITVDWYRALLKKYPGRFKCLYASSVRDYLLSAFYNEMTSGSYSTNIRVRKIFRRQLSRMLVDLKEINPDFRFFINNKRNAIMTVGSGGTIHTAVREPYFYTATPRSVSMAGWLLAGVNGEGFDQGMKYL